MSADGFPASLRDVVDAMGPGVALQLMALYGGQDVLFGGKPKQAMIDLFGEKRAEELNELLKHQKMYIPNGKAVNLRAEVLRLQAQNIPQTEIGRVLGISTRHVRRLSPAPPAPLPLFSDVDDDT